MTEGEIRLLLGDPFGHPAWKNIDDETQLISVTDINSAYITEIAKEYTKSENNADLIYLVDKKLNINDSTYSVPSETQIQNIEVELKKYKG